MSSVETAGPDHSFKQLRRDLKAAASLMELSEVKFLVQTYYEFQKYRIVSNNRVKAVERRNTKKAEETQTDIRPVACLNHFTDHFAELEKSMITPLKAFVESNPVGQWLISQKGVGPVIAAGFLSYLDITRAPSASHFISYAGLDPSVSWDKEKHQWKRSVYKYNTETGKRDFITEKLLGAKRPFNTELKTLCFKFSKSIVMTGKGEFYRELYDSRKAWETERNNAGQYKEQAAALLLKIKKGDVKDLIDDGDDEKTEEEKEKELKTYRAVLESGKLVPAHIDARARRHLNTIFLNHIFVIMYEDAYKRKAPRPYAFEHLGHVDYLSPPKYDHPWG